jgi:predicted heme/steroid binding protein
LDVDRSRKLAWLTHTFRDHRGRHFYQSFTGKDGPDDPIYVALQGEVYDVSEARDFYGPEGVYGGFAGHDVTKAFALNSLEEKDLDVTE